MAKASPSPQRAIKRVRSGSIPDPLGLGPPSVAIPGERAEWPPNTRRIMGTGYIHVKKPLHPRDPDGKCRVELEHRLVLERELGRPLQRGESARHRNNDSLDNRPENLLLYRGNSPVDLEAAKLPPPGRARARKKRRRTFVLLPVPKQPKKIRALSARAAEERAGEGFIAVPSSRLRR